MKPTSAVICLLVATLASVDGQHRQGNVYNAEPVVQDVRIECNSNDIIVSVSTNLNFNGMVYPKGLSKNSSCMAEFLDNQSPIRYKLPLRSCNTMSADVSDGIEYFNTIVVQPHRKLVTNQGRGYHIRCKYQTREKTVSSNFNVSFEGTTPLTATAPMPGCSMKIFFGDAADNRVAENVRIGDPLTLVVSIDNQQIFGMKVTECLVRDGLGWGEQLLINKEGCPVDYEIMGPFTYSGTKTTASVHFQAHKFPYTASVYYQCNVKLCINSAGGCDDVPPRCDAHGHNVRRRRAAEIIEEGDIRVLEEAEVQEDLVIEVFSGLYVNEVEDEEDATPPPPTDGATRDLNDPNTVCISHFWFAVGIAIAGLILMLAVIAAILILITRRRRKRDSSTASSSLYSGGYTNTAYSHSS